MRHTIINVLVLLVLTFCVRGIEAQILYNNVGHIPISHKEPWTHAGMLTDVSSITPKAVFVVPYMPGSNLDAKKAHHSWQVTLGGNFSYLKEPAYCKPGKSLLFGFGKYWQLNQSLGLRTELVSSRTIAMVKNKSVQPSYLYGIFPNLSDEETSIRYFDVDIRLQWLEIPILITAEMKLRKYLSIGMEIGYSLKFPIGDGSESTLLRRMNVTDLSEEEQRNFRYDYRFTNIGENYSYAGNSFCPTAGFYLIYSRLQLDVRYQYAIVDWVTNIVMQDMPLRTMNFSVGYYFK